MFNWYDSSETEAQEFEHYAPRVVVRDHRSGGHAAVPRGHTMMHGSPHAHGGFVHGRSRSGHAGLFGQHAAHSFMGRHMPGHGGFGGSSAHGHWHGAQPNAFGGGGWGHTVQPGMQRWSSPHRRRRWPQYPWSNMGDYGEPDASYPDDFGDGGFAPQSYQVPVPVPVPVPMPSPAAMAPDASSPGAVSAPAAVGGDPAAAAAAGAVQAQSPSQEVTPWLHRLLDRELSEFEAGHHYGTEPAFEYETLPADRMRMLSLRIPDAPYSDEAFSRLHQTIDIAENVHLTLGIFAPELVELLGVGADVLLGPIAASVLSFMALGAGYAEARALVAKKNVTSGFALGVVLGADERKWSYVKERYFQRVPTVNHFDEQAGVIAMNSFNLGLAAGFVQGRKLLGTNKQHFLWTSLHRALTPSDHIYYRGDSKEWGPGLWRDWYIQAAANFVKLYVKP